MTRTVLLSIRPRFASAILDGSKTYELRRRFPSVLPGTLVLLYASTPTMAVVGSFVTAEIKRAPTGEIWSALKQVLALEPDEYSAYLSPLTHGVAIEATQVRRFREPLPLAELRSGLGLEPPQSFRYLPATAQTALEAWLSTHEYPDELSRSKLNEARLSRV